MNIDLRFLLLNSLFLILFLGSTTASGISNILIVGDSLSAAYGIEPDKGWTTLLQQKFQQEKLPFHVINMSMSGNTTQDGLDKLPAALATYQPKIVIVALGANDGLRGLPASLIKQNLNKIIELSEASQSKVLLVGILIPLNYGPIYRNQFENVYKELVKETHVLAVPFMLEGIALRPELLLEDGLHPNTAAQPLILANIWPRLKELLN